MLKVATTFFEVAINTITLNVVIARIKETMNAERTAL
jgi:hypothetical protein